MRKFYFYSTITGIFVVFACLMASAFHGSEGGNLNGSMDPLYSPSGEERQILPREDLVRILETHAPAVLSNPTSLPQVEAFLDALDHLRLDPSGRDPGLNPNSPEIIETPGSTGLTQHSPWINPNSPHTLIPPGGSLTPPVRGPVFTPADPSTIIGPVNAVECRIVSPSGARAAEVPEFYVGDRAYWLNFISNGIYSSQVQFLLVPLYAGSPLGVQEQEFNFSPPSSSDIATPFGIPAWGGGATMGPWALLTTTDDGNFAFFLFTVI